ncbi:MAG: MFS transporter [Prochlorotrichaceae cyanobacterium]|jgi:predicted MFS family arabinose efflux permease
MIPPASPESSSDRLPLRFWIVALVNFINAISFTILIPILYPYAKAFGLTDFQASLLTTVYALSQFIATPILGRCSDAWGRKPLLVMSLAGTALSNLVASITPVAWLLFVARIFDGVTGGNTSIAAAVISDTTTPQDRARAFGLFDASLRLGFITGPVISYFAQKIPTFPGVSHLGMSFFAAMIMATIATLLTLFYLPETLKTPRPLVLDGSLFNLKGWLRLLKNKTIANVILLTFLSGGTFTIFTFALQPFFLNVLGQKIENIAILITLVGISGVATQVFTVGRITKTFNLAIVLFVALMMRGFIFLAMPTFPNLITFTGLTILLGAVNAFPLPIMNSILTLKSTEQEQGEVLGLSASALSIANAIGPAIAGGIVSLSYQTPFYVAGFLTLCTAGFALFLRSSLMTPKT